MKMRSSIYLLALVVVSSGCISLANISSQVGRNESSEAPKQERVTLDDTADPQEIKSHAEKAVAGIFTVKKVQKDKNSLTIILECNHKIVGSYFVNAHCNGITLSHIHTTRSLEIINNNNEQGYAENSVLDLQPAIIPAGSKGLKNGGFSIVIQQRPTKARNMLSTFQLGDESPITSVLIDTQSGNFIPITDGISHDLAH